MSVEKVFICDNCGDERYIKPIESGCDSWFVLNGKGFCSAECVIEYLNKDKKVKPWEPPKQNTDRYKG